MISSRMRGRGFTLIELLIAIAVLAILIVLGIPSFSEWIHNTQVRNAAEGVLHGLQVARAEAVRRNGYTQFMLLNGSGNTVEIDGINYETGRGWRVVAVTPPSGGGGAACMITEEIQRQDGSEGTGSAAVAVDPVGLASVTFSPMGWVGSPLTSPPTACGDPIAALNFDSAALSADRSRQLRVVINRGGGILLCDPGPHIGADDPRACPP